MVTWNKRYRVLCRFLPTVSVTYDYCVYPFKFEQNVIDQIFNLHCFHNRFKAVPQLHRSLRTSLGCNRLRTNVCLSNSTECMKVFELKFHALILAVGCWLAGWWRRPAAVGRWSPLRILRFFSTNSPNISLRYHAWKRSFSHWDPAASKPFCCDAGPGWIPLALLAYDCSSYHPTCDVPASQSAPASNHNQEEMKEK